MSKCKSCGGSLTKVGTAPLDKKLCFVCYLAKQNNRHIDKINNLEEEIEELKGENKKLKHKLIDRETTEIQTIKKLLIGKASLMYNNNHCYPQKAVCWNDIVITLRNRIESLKKRNM